MPLSNTLSYERRLRDLRTLSPLLLNWQNALPWT